MKGTLIIPLFQMWKLRTREVRELAQSHTAFVRVGLDSEPGRSTPELAFLIMPVVTTVLPHATVFIISVCEPPIFEDLTQKSYCHHLAPSYSTFLQASVTTVSSLTSTGLQVSAPSHSTLTFSCLPCSYRYTHLKFFSKLYASPGKAPVFPLDHVLASESSH